MTSPEHSEPKTPMTWAEKLEKYAVLAHELGGYSDEMVALLTEHGESNWTRVYARFGRAIRDAQSDRQRQKAIDEINSIYGGMGSWNDFYLTALGEAEAQRTRLSYAIQSTCETLSRLIDQAPREPSRGLLNRFAEFFLR